MKITRYIFILIVSSLLMTSCLDEDPKYTMDQEVVFNSAESAKQALDACYGYLTPTEGFGQGVYEVSVGGSGLSWAQTNASEADFYASLNVYVSGDALLWAWRGLYKAVQESNAFIANMNASPLSTEIKQNYTGQAAFVRGLAYYYLSMMWGGVPLTLEPASSDAVATSKADFSTVASAIIVDWTYAYNNIPDAQQHEDGYIDKKGVAAYLAKIYWMLSCNPDLAGDKAYNLGQAKYWGDLVMGKWSLQPKYSDLFVNHVNGSPESIFQLNYSTSSDYSYNRLNWIFAADNCSNGVAYQRVRATKWFHDLFYGKSLKDGGTDIDPRYYSTFLTRWANAKDATYDGYVRDSVFTYPHMSYSPNPRVDNSVGTIHYGDLADPTNPSLEELQETPERYGYKTQANPGVEPKPIEMYGRFADGVGDHQGWPLWKKQIDFNCASQHSNNNIILYRYADFLLMMADVYNELGDAGTARGYVNQVLLRARQSATNGYSSQPADLPDNLSGTELRERIFWERLYELAGEADTYIEVRRRGIESLRWVLAKGNQHAITKQHSEGQNQLDNPTQRFRDRYFGADGTFYGSVDDDNFLKKNLLLPIPLDELTSNEALSSADQNFGY